MWSYAQLKETKQLKESGEGVSTREGLHKVRELGTLCQLWLQEQLVVGEKQKTTFNN